MTAAPDDKVERVRDLTARHIGRQVQGVQHQRRRFINRVVGAVAKMQAGFVHAAGAPTDQIADRVQMRGNVVVVVHRKSAVGGESRKGLQTFYRCGSEPDMLPPPNPPLFQA